MDLFTVAKSVPIAKVYEAYTGKKVSKKGNVSCPFHGDDKHPSMKLYEENNTFYCFTCHASGSNIDLVAEIQGWDNPVDAARDICRVFNLEYDDHERKYPKEYIRYVQVMSYFEDLFNYLLNTAPNPEYFINDRGIVKYNEILHYKDRVSFGYCPAELPVEKEEDRAELQKYGILNEKGKPVFADRYIIPIKNSRGHTVGFAGRSLNPDKPKYLNTAETQFFCKKKMLFNYYLARRYKKVIVVEGFLDALSLVEVGFKNTVALMGTSLNDYHLRTMLKDREIVLALDNDGPGRKATYDIIQNNPDIKFSVVKKIPYKDFNECLLNMKPEEIVELVNDTISGPEFLIDYLTETTDLSKIENRENVWYSLATVIGTLNPEYQQTYPLNKKYSPVAIEYYWGLVDKVLKKA